MRGDLGERRSGWRVPGQNKKKLQRKDFLEKGKEGGDEIVEVDTGKKEFGFRKRGCVREAVGGETITGLLM